MKTVKLQRPEPLQIELESGLAFIVQPATRDRVRAAIALDLDQDDAPESPAESPADMQARVALQVEALVGPEVCLVEGKQSRNVPSGPVLDGLTPAEEMQILWALWGQATGYSPAASVAVLKKKVLFGAILATAAAHGSSASTPKPPTSPTI